jgi:hypothetical protein
MKQRGADWVVDPPEVLSYRRGIGRMREALPVVAHEDAVPGRSRMRRQTPE